MDDIATTGEEEDAIYDDSGKIYMYCKSYNVYMF